MPLLFSHFNPFLLKLLSLSHFFFLYPLGEEAGRSPTPWAFAPRHVTLFWVSVTSWPLLSGPWVPGCLCIPTLNSGCVDTVLVVLSRFSDTQQVNHEWEQGQSTAMDGWMMAVVILGVEVEPVDSMVFLLTTLLQFLRLFFQDMLRDPSPIFENEQWRYS